MSPITAKLLDSYPYSQYATAQTLSRGVSYYHNGRVYEVKMKNGGSKAVCSVDGDSGSYTVVIKWDENDQTLYFDCDCPYAEDNFCKHMVAAGFKASEYLKKQGGKTPAIEEADEDDWDDDEFDDDEDHWDDDLDDDEGIEADPYVNVKPIVRPVVPPPSQLTPTHNWQYKLDGALAQVSRRQSVVGMSAQKYVAVFLLDRVEYPYGGGSLYYKPYVIQAKNWHALNAIDYNDRQAVNALLNSNGEWIRLGQEYRTIINPHACLNLTPEAVTFLISLIQTTRFFGGSNLTTYFPLIAHFGIPIFLTNQNKGQIHSRLEIIPEPLDIQIVFSKQEDDLVLEASVKSDPPIHGKVEPLSYGPIWVLCADKIFQLRSTNGLNIISSFPIRVPAKHADIFREKYLRRVAELFPVKSDLLKWRDVESVPVPRLYLHDDKDNALRADLLFGYGEHELPAIKSEESIAVETVPDSWELIRIHRDRAREENLYQLLTDPNFRLKRSGAGQPFHVFQLRARAHPFDFLLHSVPLLAQAGFEIYGEENLKLGKINRSTPVARVHITSGIDWFDIKAYIEYGDQQVSLHDVRRAMRRGEKYIKLADGSVGQIPQEWLEKYKHLFGMAEETDDGFRVADFHIPLVDQLLDDDASIPTPRELIQRREHLRSFEKIAVQPLPKGFTGELRHYQHSGFEWLHFLREYKFGGILADDMGLGKTIQVLTYLQSLKETRWQSETEGVGNHALVVVPKSLIVNWQRESEKFTPALKFLDYTGNFRKKDAESFKGYDVILTTYGVLLRDIESLSKYRFDMVILDESQAIKNPNSQSAKAARVLKSNHRLVMTGTPVENNTFELWSQFAFLNPGLLGSMEYFKKEFANPIESAGDEKTAKLLRQLVYPFILRRTKEQVAPELPPRTERVVYTDMEPAQKKLYTQTRERYRAELLGLIETEGMNDARFKILEGLLRLRQIAIHPALVDSKYKGEAPKFEFLLETLETLQAENHKALIFSQFVGTLKLLRNELDTRGIKYMYLDGQTQKRQDHVDAFQNNDSIPFFLISLKAGGVGLNLTAADYVIHLDPWWNPAVEMQATDRAHRIGQDKPVIVYKIIARESVEEKILQLQEKKRKLVEQLITTEAGFFKSLTKEDVGILFG